MEEGIRSEEGVAFELEDHDLKVVLLYLAHLSHLEKYGLTSLAINSSDEKSTWKSTLKDSSASSRSLSRMSTECDESDRVFTCGDALEFPAEVLTLLVDLKVWVLSYR